MSRSLHGAILLPEIMQAYGIFQASCKKCRYREPLIQSAYDGQNRCMLCEEAVLSQQEEIPDNTWAEEYQT